MNIPISFAILSFSLVISCSRIYPQLLSFLATCNAAEAVTVNVEQEELANAEEAFKIFWPLNRHHPNQPQVPDMDRRRVAGSLFVETGSSFWRHTTRQHHAKKDPIQEKAPKPSTAPTPRTQGPGDLTRLLRFWTRLVWVSSRPSYSCSTVHHC